MTYRRTGTGETWYIVVSVNWSVMAHSSDKRVWYIGKLGKKEFGKQNNCGRGSLEYRKGLADISVDRSWGHWRHGEGVDWIMENWGKNSFRHSKYMAM